jgi:hypothetical protein
VRRESAFLFFIFYFILFYFLFTLRANTGEGIEVRRACAGLASMGLICVWKMPEEVALFLFFLKKYVHTHTLR